MNPIYCLRKISPLRLGTIITPKKPAGKRALFYKDKEGNHWPVQPIMWLKTKILPGKGQKQTAILAPRWYFYSLLKQKSLTCPGEFNGLNSLPSQIKSEIYFDYVLALFTISKSSPISDMSWNDQGIHRDQLKVEAKTGTYYIERTSYFEPSTSHWE